MAPNVGGGCWGSMDCMDCLLGNCWDCGSAVLPNGPGINCTLDDVVDGGGGGAASLEGKVTLLFINPGDAVREELALSAPLLPLVTIAVELTGDTVEGPFSVGGRT